MLGLRLIPYQDSTFPGELYVAFTNTTLRLFYGLFISNNRPITLHDLQWGCWHYSYLEHNSIDDPFLVDVYQTPDKEYRLEYDVSFGAGGWVCNVPRLRGFYRQLGLYTDYLDDHEQYLERRKNRFNME